MDFDSFSVVFILAFLAILGVIVFIVIRVVKDRNQIKNTPRLTVPATVVFKREDIAEHRDRETLASHTSTSYFATFEFESGDQQEFPILSWRDYDKLTSGDQGRLTFQGPIFLSFEKQDSTDP